MPVRPLLMAFLLLAAAPTLTTPAGAQDYECDKPKGWKPTDVQLQTILTRHKEWLSIPSEERDLNDESRANLCNADLQGDRLAKAAEQAGLSEVNLRNAVLNGAFLREAELNGAKLTGTELNEVDLIKAKLNRAKLWEAKLNRAKLWEAKLNDADLRQAELNRANLRGAELNGARLTGAELNGADLAGTKLNCLDPDTSRPRCADLSNAELNGTYLRQAELNRANLRGAKLNQANLPGAELNGANLRGAELNEADLKEAKLNCLRPDTPRPGCADLGGAELNGARLRGAELNGANLVMAEFNCLTPDATEPHCADLHDAELNGADLAFAELNGANLEGAELNGAYLSGAELNEANLTEAELKRAILDRIELNGAIFEPVVTTIRNTQFRRVISLHLLRYIKDPHALVKLRQGFREAGRRDLERQITHAIKRSERINTQEKGGLSVLEAGFNFVLFEFTTKWGLSPGRALIILSLVVLLCAVFYVQAVYVPITKKGAIYRVWEASPEQRDQVRVASLQAVLWALYFSIMSAFHIGFRELNIGNWIQRINPHDYSVRASGWVKTLSGVQSVLSVYLLAIWALTYFGRPFD